ncbi:MAG: T9SS type A sorting domain-containing protein [Bacteroidia bacterium]
MAEIIWDPILFDQRISIQTLDWNKGVYFIIITNQNRTAVKKVVVN